MLPCLRDGGGDALRSNRSRTHWIVAAVSGLSLAQVVPTAEASDTVWAR